MPTHVPRMAAYEVRCERCSVSFPPETRRCMHCGGPTSRARPEVVSGGQVVIHRQGGPEALGPEELAGADPESTSRTPLRIATGLVWILVAVGGALYRACTGGAG